MRSMFRGWIFTELLFSEIGLLLFFDNWIFCFAGFIRNVLSMWLPFVADGCEALLKIWKSVTERAVFGTTWFQAVAPALALQQAGWFWVLGREEILLSFWTQHCFVFERWPSTEISLATSAMYAIFISVRNQPRFCFLWPKAMLSRFSWLREPRVFQTSETQLIYWLCPRKLVSHLRQSQSTKLLEVKFLEWWRQ